MEISKALQEEILCVQNKLKNAIRDHQICVVKLKDDPNNTDILDRIREIQLHIVSLGRWQKQVVERLRKEVESYKAENALNGARVSVATFLGLNNNNHMTNNNEVRRCVEVGHHTNGHVLAVNGHPAEPIVVRTANKEDYEEVVRNGDVGSPLRDDGCVKGERRSSSAEPTSCREEDIAEEAPLATRAARMARAAAAATTVSSCGTTTGLLERYDTESEVADKKPTKPLLTAREQQCFLGCLGLITSARLLELQNKRAERKRRSTANSHFVYSNWEVPMKRKRHAYLQSLGNAPQTRQTTARLNGPSPPPSSTCGIKSTSKPPPPPPTTTSTSNLKSNNAAATKSLIQTKAVMTTALANPLLPKPNILRNGDGKQQQQQKEFYEKLIKQEKQEAGATTSGGRVERELQQQQSAKLVTQSTGKTVHIPGLPSGLTIERIENDSTVCITCRNPGTLTVCEYCSAKFHVSCHTSSPASTCYCPKCAARFMSKGLSSSDLEILRLEMKSVKKEKEAVAAVYASRAFGKAGEDAEVHKASGGLYKADATQARELLTTAAALGINQLPSSTFLIPIATDAALVPAVTAATASASASTSASTAAAAATSGDSLSVTAVDEPLVLTATSAATLGATAATTIAASSLSYGVAEQQQQQQLQQQKQQSQPQQQSSILLSQLSQPSVASVVSSSSSSSSNEPRLLCQGAEIVSHGQSFLVIEKLSGQPLGQRRWSTDRAPIKSKQAVSVLDYEWSGRSSVGAESQQSGLSVAKSGNYVTVEVICNDDDRAEAASENSADCVYVSESSSGVPDVIDLESPRPNEVLLEKHRDPEVLNISSGSSEKHPVVSPQPSPAAEHLEAASASPGSPTDASIIHKYEEQQQQQYLQEQEEYGDGNRDDDEGSGNGSGNDNSVCNDDNNGSDTGSSCDNRDDFLGSIFPGRYGFKIDNVDVDVESSSNSTSAYESSPDSPGGRGVEHVKLEEAHLPAPPTAELIAETVPETSGSERLTTVPDNKSDADDAAAVAAVVELDHRDGDDEQRNKGRDTASPTADGSAEQRDESASTD